jgi:hypothetical protein
LPKQKKNEPTDLLNSSATYPQAQTKMRNLTCRGGGGGGGRITPPNVSTLPVTPLPLVRGQQLSRPGAFSIFRDFRVEYIAILRGVRDAPILREYTRGESLVEANLVTEPDLLVREIVEDPQPVVEKGFWVRHRVRLLVFSLLVVIGLATGVGVQGGGSASESRLFDCSNAAVGCLYAGTDSLYFSLYFQDPGSFLVANCTDTDFDIPTSDNCDCEINVPTYTPQGFESCQSCSFVDSADGGWQIAYDCSNLLIGDCRSRDTSINCISRKGFESTTELRSAVGRYLADNSGATLVARTYGWPIGV